MQKLLAIKNACESSESQRSKQFIAKSLLSSHFRRNGGVQKASGTSSGATAMMRQTGVVTRALSYNNNNNNIDNHWHCLFPLDVFTKAYA